MNKDSMRMFLATIMEESGYGQWTLEHGSTSNTRGAGYGQITGSDNHNAFLKFVGDNYLGENTAYYIGNDYMYSMLSAGWAWAWNNYGLSGGGDSVYIFNNGSLHDYVCTYGGGDGTFLVASWTYQDRSKAPDDVKREVRQTNNFSYNANSNQITISDNSSYAAPTNWSRRIGFYNKAKSIF